MTTTLQTIVNAVDPLNRLMEMDLPARTAYKVMTLADAINEHTTRYNKLRNELFTKYGENLKDENGNETGQVQITPENNAAFSEEHYTLLQEEVELTPPHLTLSDLEAVSVKPKDLMRLREFVTDE